MYKGLAKGALLSAAILLAGCNSAAEKVSEYVSSAKGYLEAGDYQSAHLEFGNALKINPDHPEALFLVTQVFEQQQEWPKVYRYLQRVVELEPNHVDALIKLGQIEVASQQLDKAMQRSERVLALVPEDARAHALHSMVLLKVGDAEGAVAAANKARAIEPVNKEATLVLATERMEAEQPAEALVFLKEIEATNDLIVHMMEIRAFNALDDLEGAVAIHRKLMQLNPEEQTFGVALAKQYIQFKDYDAARAVFEELTPQHADDNKLKLTHLQFLERFYSSEAAEAQLTQFLSDQPNNAELNFFQVARDLSADRTYAAIQRLQAVAEFEKGSDDGLRALNQLARMADRSGDDALVEQYSAQVLEVDASNEAMNVLLAERLLRDGKNEEASAKLRNLLRDNPRSAPVLALLGRLHQSEGRIELAKDQYAKAIESDPNNLGIALSYGQLLVSQRNFSLANQILEPRLARHGNNADLLKMMAQIKLSLQEWELAQQLADQLEKVNKLDLAVTQIRGVAQMGQQNFEEGLSEFQKAYNEAANKDRPMVTLVRSYLAMKKPDEALSFLEGVLRNDADNLGALLLTGQIKAMTQDAAGAEQAFQSALSAHADDAQVYRQYAAYMMRSDRMADAMALLDRGINQVERGQLALMMLKATTQQQRGDIDGAVVSYEALLAKYPESDIAANNLAVIYTDETAHRNLERAQELAGRFRQSEVPYFQDTLGWVNLQAGNLNDALYFHETAVEALPEQAEMRYHLGMAYKAAGDANRAKYELERSLELAANTEQPWMGAAQAALSEI